MKMNAYVAGVGMTRFGRMMDRGLKSIGGEAIEAALADAGIEKKDVQAAWMSNAAAGCADRPGVHPRPGGPAQHRHGRPARGQRRERLRQRLDRVQPGVRDGHRRPLRRRSRLRRRENVPRGQGKGLRRLHGRGRRRAAASRSSRRCRNRLRRAARRRPRKGAGQNRSMFMDIYAAAARGHMAALRHHGRAVRDDLGEELLPRLAQSARAVPRGRDGRGSAGRADDRRTIDPADVLADRRRRRRRRDRQRTQEARARV